MARIKINELPAIAQVVTTTEFAADDIGQTGQTTKVTGQQLQDFISVGAGNIGIVGTPVADQVMVWASAATAEGDPNYTWNGTTLAIVGNITVTGTVDGVDVSTLISATEANVVAALNGATLTDVGTPASGDLILLQDASDSNNLKVAQFSTFGGAGGEPSDGDKGDITVSGSGLTWTIDDDAVTYAKIQNVSQTNVILGRDTAGAGIIEEIAPAAARTLLDVDQSGTDNSTPVTLAGTPDYITISGQQITRNQIDLTTDVTGLLPSANIVDEFLANTGDTGTGAYDFGGATSFEIPNGTAPTVDAAGEVAIDTNGVSPITDGVMRLHDGTRIQNIVSARNLPTSDNDVPAFDSATGSIQWQAQSGAGGGISNIVEDTTPQLGGNLDANAFNVDFDDNTGIRDSNGNEQLVFQQTASAVNHIEITNAATANDPIIAAAGDDTNIDLTLQAKGSGVVQVGTDLVITESAAQQVSNKTIDNATFEGVLDAGTATSFEIPNGAAPVVNAAGEIAVDTSITDYTGMIKYHDGTEELTVLAVPTANLSTTNGQVPSYNATNNELEFVTPAGGGNVSNSGTPVDNQLAVWNTSTTIEGDANLTWTGSLLGVGANIELTGAVIGPNTTSTVAISGGSTAALGGNAIFHGEAATNANDIEFRSGTDVRLLWDNSAVRWDFQDRRVSGVAILEMPANGAIESELTTSSITLSGGSTASLGGNILVRGEAATNANDIEFRSATTVNLRWDDSADNWDFLDNEIVNGKWVTDINAQTGTSYTLVLDDASKFVSMNNAAANTLTIPPNSSVAFPVGTEVAGAQIGAGQTTLAAGAGVTLNSADSNLACRVQHSGWSAIKTATDTWQVFGDLA